MFGLVLSAEQNGENLSFHRIYIPEKIEKKRMLELLGNNACFEEIGSIQWGTTLEGISSVQFSRSVVSDSLQPHESQHARPPCPSPSPGVHSDSRPLSP